jgi:hypothetical protein
MADRLTNPVALALAVERRIASGDADEDERRMLAALNAAFEEERDWNQRLRAAAERLMAALIDRELVAYGKRDKRLMAPDHEARLAEIPWEDLVEDGVTLTLRGRMQQQSNLLVAGINGRPGYGSVRFRAADIAALAASYRPWGARRRLAQRPRMLRLLLPPIRRARLRRCRMIPPHRSRRRRPQDPPLTSCGSRIMQPPAARCPPPRRNERPRPPAELL